MRKDPSEFRPDSLMMPELKIKTAWLGEGPTQAEVARLLAGVADVMGVEAPKDEKDPAFEATWKEFVRRVYSWERAEVPEQLPAVDSKEVWNRFLNDGVWRLMAYDPEHLAKIAPEKFLYLNALGWNARLDLKAPGPLCYSGAEFERMLPKPVRKILQERIMLRGD